MSALVAKEKEENVVVAVGKILKSPSHRMDIKCHGWILCLVLQQGFLKKATTILSQYIKKMVAFT